jgi:nucleoid-associated protein YgaU
MDNLKSFHPAVVQPVERQQHSQPTGTQAMNVPLTVTVSNLLVVAAIIGTTWTIGYDVAVVLRWMLAYFALSTVIFVISANGSLTEMFRIWQIEHTERERIAAHADILESWIHAQQVQPAQLPERVERTSPVNARYVPATPGDADGIHTEALQWVSSLYDGRGAPHPRKVNADGRLKVRMLGSKRGGGNPDAGKWLLHQGIIRRVEGGYSLNVYSYPNRNSLPRL